MYSLKSHIQLVVVVIALVVAPFSIVKAQWKLDVKGTVKNEDTKKRFEGVTVTIKRNGAVWKTLTSPATGEFELELPPDGIYLVEFSKPGFTSKRIEFSTKDVPPEDAKYGFEFPMEMNLFEEVEGLDVSILNQPIAKIAFNPESGYMDYNPSYTKSIQKELEQLKKDLEIKKKQQEEQRKAKAKEYATVIAAADKAFNAKNFSEAKPLYEKAAKLLPSESYPQSQLGLISDQLKGEEEANKKYATAIERADAAFKERNWEKAMMEYNAALTHKPNEVYPKNKIKEIEDIISKDKKITKEYNELIVSADAYLINKEYEKAKTDFQKASALKDYEQYPKDKLKEIEGALAEIAKKEAEEKALNEKYQALIAAADKLLSAKTYQDAKAKYNEAIKIKPSEQYPKDKLVEIDGLIAEAAKKEAEEKALNEKYQAAISSADKALASKLFDDAKGKYNEALTLKSAEQYPKDKLKEIEGILAEIAKKEAEEKALNEKYQAAITAADNFLTAKNYQEAKAKYSEASTLKPVEKYPKDKLKEIEDALAALAKKEAEEKALNEKYSATILAADNAFNSKSYQEAKTKYSEALKIKPTEQHPKDRIAEIDGLIAEAAKKEAEEKALNEKYKAIILVADKAFTAKSYQEAKTKYQEALALKSAEQYPKDKVQEIEGILAELAKKEAEEKALNEKYQALIAAADKSLGAKMYEEAKNKYNEAIGLKSAEKYPKDKIKEIDGILAEIAKKKAEEEASKMADKEKTEKYNQLIAAGDKAFESKTYQEAQNSYNAALGVKPTEQYPKEKLKEIEGILATLAKQKADEAAALKAEKEKNEKYQQLITAADKLLGTKSYEQAKVKYNEALTIKPSEKYPQDKLNEIDALLNALASKEEQEKALNDKYKAAILAADKAFSSKLYQEAKGKYSEALGLKTDEKYPKDKLTEIENLLAELAKKENESELEKEAEKKKREYYQAIIAQADAEYYADNFDKAAVKYNESLLIYPTEKYPKDQLKAIETAKLKKQNETALNEKYNALIAEADGAFNAQKYDGAKAKYNEALKLKSAQYPKDKLAEIEKILADLAKEKISVIPNAQEQKKKEYQSFIELADKQFSAKSYEQSKNSYQKALSLMPDENYPKEKIEEINKILAEIAEKERKQKSELLASKSKKEKYDKLIFDGDKYFMLDNFESAKTNYKEALILFENEQYPKDQLVKIEAALQRIKDEKAAKEVVVTKKTLQPGERAKIDDKREREIEARFAKRLAEKEKAKDERLQQDKKNYNKQNEVLVSSSIDKTNKAQQEIIATVEQIEKNNEKGNKYYIENDNQLQFEKKSYTYQDSLRYSAEKEELRLAQNEINITTKKIETDKLKGNKYHIENEKTLRNDIQTYKQAEKDRKDKADSRRNDANNELIKQHKEMNKYEEINEPIYEQKVESLNAYKENLKENSIILVEKSDDKRRKNNSTNQAIKAKIEKDNAANEKRQNERKEDVRQYAIDLKIQDQLLLKGALQRVEDNRRFLAQITDQIALREQQKSKLYKLNVERIAQETEAYRKLEENRKQAETRKNATATAQLYDYKKQLGTEQEKHNKNADKRRENSGKEIELAKETLNKPTEEQTQASINAFKKIQKESQFYSDYNSKLTANQIERSTKADAEKNDVYVGEQLISNNIGEFGNKYPQGITEEEKETGNAIVLTRIKVTDKHVDVYEKIFYNWGGIFYSKNGESISQHTWDNESIEK